MGQCALNVEDRSILIITFRPQGHSSPEACLSRNVRSRYVLGFFPRPRSYVFRQIPPETSRISRSGSELPAGYRSLDVGYKSFEEGIKFMKKIGGRMLSWSRI
jgi:hypothetical protein